METRITDFQGNEIATLDNGQWLCLECDSHRTGVIHPNYQNGDNSVGALIGTGGIMSDGFKIMRCSNNKCRFHFEDIIADR